MANSADSQLQAMIQNMPEKTGKAIAEWQSLLSETELKKHSDIVNYLKQEHGVSHGYANTIAHLYRDQISGKPKADEDLVAKQYAGKKAALLPIYEALLDLVQNFGSDVEIAPKKTYVSLRRHKQFAIIKAATQSRVDLGLNLNDVEETDRLKGGKVFSGMCSHLLRLTDVAEIDEDVINWLKVAYQEA
jgi:predicted transport protein